jgi:hypothetical protein
MVMNLIVMLSILYYFAGSWQPVTVVPEQPPTIVNGTVFAYVSDEPNTLTSRGNFLWAHSTRMGSVISDMRYGLVEYNGNLYHFDHLKAYTAWQLRQIPPDVRHADLAIMTCFTFRGELGRVIYYFVKGEK